MRSLACMFLALLLIGQTTAPATQPTTREAREARRLAETCANQEAETIIAAVPAELLPPTDYSKSGDKPGRNAKVRAWSKQNAEGKTITLTLFRPVPEKGASPASGRAYLEGKDILIEAGAYFMPEMKNGTIKPGDKFTIKGMIAKNGGGLLVSPMGKITVFTFSLENIELVK